MQANWQDRKGRLPIHYTFDGMCLDTFLIVSRIEFVVLWGCLIRGGRAKLLGLLLAGSRRYTPFSCCAQAHRFAAAFPRENRSFGAPGVLARFIVAVVALDFVESRQSEHSRDSCIGIKVIDSTYCLHRTLFAGGESDVPH